MKIRTYNPYLVVIVLSGGAEQLLQIRASHLERAKQGEAEYAYKLASEFLDVGELERVAFRGDRIATFTLAEKYNNKAPLIDLAKKGDMEAIAVYEFLTPYSQEVAHLDYEETRPFAEAGNPAAQYKMYLMPDNEGKYLWLCRAADNASHEARYRLGEFYLLGVDGFKKSNVQAYKWYSLSALSHWQDAKSLAAYVRTQMTPEDINVAEQLVESWMPGECRKEVEQRKAP